MILMQTSKEIKHGHSQALCSLGCYWVVLETMSPRNQNDKKSQTSCFSQLIEKPPKCSQHAYGITPSLLPFHLQ